MGPLIEALIGAPFTTCRHASRAADIVWHMWHHLAQFVVGTGDNFYDCGVNPGSNARYFSDWFNIYQVRPACTSPVMLSCVCAQS